MGTPSPTDEEAFDLIMTGITFAGIAVGVMALVYHLVNCDCEPSKLKYVSTDKPLSNGKKDQHDCSGDIP